MLRHHVSDGGKKPDHRGEHEAAVKTVAQETPGDPALPVVTCSCAFIFAREAAGAVGTRRFLRPLLFRGSVFASSGRDPCRGNASAWLFEIRVRATALTCGQTTSRQPAARSRRHLPRCRV